MISQASNKEKGRKGFQTGTVDIRPEALNNLIIHMKNLVSLLNICHCFHNLNIFQQIDETPDVLSQFGSFFFVVQVKGCKGLAHVENNNLGDGMKIALERFKQSFPALDWEYMNNRKQGELFFDLGVTIHPNHSGPLVGLYRLDSLEASYGASGFNRGNLHTINTLGMFGGFKQKLHEIVISVHIYYFVLLILYMKPLVKKTTKEIFFRKTMFMRVLLGSIKK